MRRVAIIGCGVAGLSAAVYLEEARRRGEVTYSIYEASGRAGGALRTEYVEGCVVEAGADSFLSSKLAVLEICKQLGIEDKLVASNDAIRKTYVLVNGELVPMPQGMVLMVPTRMLAALTSRLFAVTTKLRIMGEFLGSYAPPPPHEFESVSSFVERHFGREMVTRVAAPLLAGVYGGDAERLGARAVIPRLVELEQQHGSLSRGMLKTRDANPSQPIFTSFTDGMNQFVEAMLQYIDTSRLHLEESVKSAMREEKNWRVISSKRTAEYFDYLILAAPAHSAAVILERQSPQLGDELRRINYASAVTVALAYAGQQIIIPQGFGFLVPRAEKRRTMACTFVHDKFPDRVPGGTKLLRAFFSADQHPELMSMSDDQIVSMAHGELMQIVGIRARPQFARVHRWPRAMPQYDIGHPELVLRISELVEKLGNLSLIGSAYNGIGIPDCVLSGKKAAEEALALAVVRSDNQ